MAKQKNGSGLNKKNIATQTLNVGRRLLYGNVVTSEFFERHFVKIIVAMILVIGYISTKYDCLTKMEEIQHLNEQLTIAKTACIHERSTYMSRTRESAMLQLVDSVIPGLTIQQQPPYVLPLEKDKAQ